MFMQSKKKLTLIGLVIITVMINPNGSVQGVSDDKIRVDVNLVLTTIASIQDIEISSRLNDLEIFLCEGDRINWNGKISQVYRDERWLYETIFEENDNWFQQLALRNRTDSDDIELFVGHSAGVSWLTRNESGLWTNSSLFSAYYTRSWELAIHDINSTIPGDEIIYVYETKLFDFGNMTEFSQSDGWAVQEIYVDNPVPMAVYGGDFNRSNPGLEIISVNEGGFIRFLQSREGIWQGPKIWDFGNALLTTIIATDLNPVSEGIEFAGSFTNSTAVYFSVFTQRNGVWEPETVLPIQGITDEGILMTDVALVKFTNSAVSDLIYADTVGNVWLVTQRANQWESQKLWQDKAAINAIATLNDSAVVIGGDSKKLMTLSLLQPIVEITPFIGIAFAILPLIYLKAIKRKQNKHKGK